MIAIECLKYGDAENLVLSNVKNQHQKIRKYL
jgi:hypothetical protein